MDKSLQTFPEKPKLSTFSNLKLPGSMPTVPFGQNTPGSSSDPLKKDLEIPLAPYFPPNHQPAFAPCFMFATGSECQDHLGTHGARPRNVPGFQHRVTRPANSTRWKYWWWPVWNEIWNQMKHDETRQCFGTLSMFGTKTRNKNCIQRKKVVTKQPHLWKFGGPVCKVTNSVHCLCPNVSNVL